MPDAKRSTLVLSVLGASQFLMILDSSVMNVSMASVAEDLDTPITGIQTAITLYMLVMASLMITGGKLGTVMGRRRALRLGLLIYGAGSLTTSLAPNLPVMLVGWSLLEGMGAALILPAIVALVAANFPRERRTAAYGLVAAAGAMAVGAGPLIGGAVTTFASWRYVFAGEVVVVLVILVFVRRLEDVAPEHVVLDAVGSVLSVLALGSVVLAVLQSGTWGWVEPRPEAPQLFGLSLVIWLLLTGLLLLYVLGRWERRLAADGREPLVPPDLLRNSGLNGGLLLFFVQFMMQAGIFFALPLFLTVVLELNALQTGVRIFPLSVALIVAAAGVPKIWPTANPRRVVRLGLLSMLVGVLLLVGGMSPGADAAVVAMPMVLLGLGLGALSSQLGGVTVSAVPDERAADVGGLQNTATNLGASLGTALVGSVLIATLTSSALSGLESNPQVPASVTQQATTKLAAGVPWLSDTQLKQALGRAGVPADQAAAIIEVNDKARLDALRTGFALIAVIAVVALLVSDRIPTAPPTRAPAPEPGRGDADPPTAGRAAGRRRDPTSSDTA
jgi:MFS family permease